MAAIVLTGAVRAPQSSVRTNSAMTSLKIGIVLLIIVAGIPEVKTANWTPLAPHGARDLCA